MTPCSDLGTESIVRHTDKREFKIAKAKRVLLANSSTKDHSCNSFKKMDPFPSLISLASHIKEFVYFTTFLIVPHRAAEVIDNMS